MNPDMQKRREELSKLSPEGRRAKVEQWRTNRPAPPVMDKQAREQRQAMMKQRLEALRAKKADGKITPEEQRMLDSLERATKLFESAPAGAARN